MDDVMKQLNRAGKILAAAIAEARLKAENQIFEKIDEELYKRGYESETADQFIDFGLQSLEKNEEEGVLIHEVFIVGEKATKKVIAAYRMEISYKPEGFSNEKALVMKVRGRVEEVTNSFVYPEDDESIYN